MILNGQFANGRIIVLLLLFFFAFTAVPGLKWKFTKLECEAHESFGIFRHCFLKALGRDTVALNLHLKVYKLPLTAIMVNVAMFRRANGYRPFMYNDSMDFCYFLKNPNRLMFWKILYMNALKPYSNINHTCPYTHDIKIDQLILNGSMLSLVPFPTNDYLFKIKVGTDADYKVEVRAYVKVYD